MDSLQKAILQTLVYADLFDYPLTTPEVWSFLIAPKKIQKRSIQAALAQKSTELKLMSTEKEFYFLKERKEIVGLRAKREKWGKEKGKIARRGADWFKLIPWIKMVGITGALAMENADQNDDIDLIIITVKNRLWLTRLFLVLLTELMGVRRRPGCSSADRRNKICLNMFLDEEHLAVPEEERNLFTAHEVCQVKLIWDKDDTYKKFLWKNQWVSKFLPNAVKIKSKVKSQKSKVQFKIQNYLFDLLEKIISIFEKNAYKFQLAYMKSKKTIEKIEKGRVLFHPGDVSGWVLEKYYNKLRTMEVRTGNGE